MTAWSPLLGHISDRTQAFEVVHEQLLRPPIPGCAAAHRPKRMVRPHIYMNVSVIMTTKSTAVGLQAREDEWSGFGEGVEPVKAACLCSILQGMEIDKLHG